MATPLLIMARGQTSEKEPARTHIGSEPETTRNRGRKPGRGGAAQKKQPQRGMGVAQLERLRLEERWKKMTEIARPESVNLPNPFDQYQTTHLPLTEPLGSVPVQFGAGSYGGVPFRGGGFSGMDRSLMSQRYGNGGFGGSGQFLADPIRIGAPDVRVQAGSVVETSTELSSMPNMQQCLPDCCDVCFKKKRFNEENIGFNGGRDKYVEDCDFLGLNLENNSNFNGESNGFGARAARSAIYAAHTLNDQGSVEVKAIHRKGNSGGGSVFMEYEFFPVKSSGRSTCTKNQLELGVEASVAVGGEASLITTTSAYGASASNSVDLSLRLSS